MTPRERYQHLTDFWKKQRGERFAERQDACEEVTKWQNKLFAAEIAEQLAMEDEL